MTRPELNQAQMPVVLRGVLVPDHMCSGGFRLLQKQVAAHRVDGGQVTPELGALLDALNKASIAFIEDQGVAARRAGKGHQLVQGGEGMSANGHAARQIADIEPRSEWRCTAEVASRLGVTDRHVRRLAAELGIKRMRNAWTAADVADLEAHLAHKRSTR